MQAPYETLLAPLRRSIASDALDRAPDLGLFLQAVKYDDDARLYGLLSGGERVLVDVAHALYNGDREARVADLAALDGECLRLVLDAFELLASRRSA